MRAKRAPSSESERTIGKQARRHRNLDNIQEARASRATRGASRQVPVLAGRSVIGNQSMRAPYMLSCRLAARRRRQSTRPSPCPCTLRTHTRCYTLYKTAQRHIRRAAQHIGAPVCSAPSALHSAYSDAVVRRSGTVTLGLYRGTLHLRFRILRGAQGVVAPAPPLSPCRPMPRPEPLPSA